MKNTKNTGLTRIPPTTHPKPSTTPLPPKLPGEANGLARLTITMAAPLYGRMEGYLTEKGRRNRSDYITEAVKLKLDTDGAAEPVKS